MVFNVCLIFGIIDVTIGDIFNRLGFLSPRDMLCWLLCCNKCSAINWMHIVGKAEGNCYICIRVLMWNICPGGTWIHRFIFSNIIAEQYYCREKSLHKKKIRKLEECYWYWYWIQLIHLIHPIHPIHPIHSGADCWWLNRLDRGLLLPRVQNYHPATDPQMPAHLKRGKVWSFSKPGMITFFLNQLFSENTHNYS